MRATENRDRFNSSITTSQARWFSSTGSQLNFYYKAFFGCTLYLYTFYSHIKSITSSLSSELYFFFPFLFCFCTSFSTQILHLTPHSVIILTRAQPYGVPGTEPGCIDHGQAKYLAHHTISQAPGISFSSKKFIFLTYKQSSQ